MLHPDARARVDRRARRSDHVRRRCRMLLSRPPALRVRFRVSTHVRRRCRMLRHHERAHRLGQRVSTHVRRRCRMLQCRGCSGPEVSGCFNPRPASLPDAAGGGVAPRAAASKVSTHVRRRCRMLPVEDADLFEAQGFNPRPASLPNVGLAATPTRVPARVRFQPTSGVAAGCCAQRSVGGGWAKSFNPRPASLPDAARRCLPRRDREGFNPRPASLPDAAVAVAIRSPSLRFQPTSGVAAGCCVEGVGAVAGPVGRFQPTSGVAAGCCARGGHLVEELLEVSTHVRRRCRMLLKELSQGRGGVTRFQPTSGVAAGCCEDDDPEEGDDPDVVSTHVRRRCRMLLAKQVAASWARAFQPTSGVAAGCCLRWPRLRRWREPRGFNPRPASLPDAALSTKPAGARRP